eukprot:TRINITY_DN7941_c0_g1_i1.p1 TRINITY_DN7941_c0_g1~~TRINITY_DN7941_c0_g1_i1.p1  ORF type:complete len:566 (+),score=120.48 TRINITY_DN7941_c0_g1_i1:74-1771(+)
MISTTTNSSSSTQEASEDKSDEHRENEKPVEALPPALKRQLNHQEAQHLQVQKLKQSFSALPLFENTEETDSSHQKSESGHEKTAEKEDSEAENSKSIIDSGAFLHSSYGFETVQGKRWSMEDTIILIPDLWSAGYESICQTLGQKRVSLFAIFDGHAGPEVSRLCKNVFASQIFKLIVEYNGDVKKALMRSFHDVDKAALSSGQSHGWISGSTALVVLLVGIELFVANAGDTEAIISKTNKKQASHATFTVEIISEKHRTSNFRERDRIIRRGGIIEDEKLFGALEVSRAIGDLPFRMPWCKKWLSINSTDSKEDEGKFLISEPHVYRRRLSATDEFLVMATDGIWDVLSYEEVAKSVYNSIKSEENAFVACEKVVKKAIKAGSADNCTIIIVYFQHFSSSANSFESFSLSSSAGSAKSNLSCGTIESLTPSTSARSISTKTPSFKSLSSFFANIAVTPSEGATSPRGTPHSSHTTTILEPSSSSPPPSPRRFSHKPHSPGISPQASPVSSPPISPRKMTPQVETATSSSPQLSPFQLPVQRTSSQKEKRRSKGLLSKYFSPTS